MLNGIINVYKEKGYTSFDVVAKLRGIFHQKKIGHTGTLDPDAVGVLPVCLGRATKVCDLLTDKDKEYEAVLLLGMETDTQDISGSVLRQAEVTCTEEEVGEAILSFIGGYDQIPPMYSALKVNGQKLYDLARQGITVERKARRVNILEIEILSMQLPEITMRVHCSKGTYIRTLCQDIGQKLGCYGCMKSLKRTRVADFKLEDALTVSQIEQLWHEYTCVNQNDEKVDNEETCSRMAAEADFSDDPKACRQVNPPAFLRTVDSLFPQLDKISLPEGCERLMRNGNKLPADLIGGEASVPGKRLRTYDWQGAFVGIYEWTDDGRELKPVRIFTEF